MRRLVQADGSMLLLPFLYGRDMAQTQHWPQALPSWTYSGEIHSRHCNRTSRSHV